MQSIITANNEYNVEIPKGERLVKDPELNVKVEDMTPDQKEYYDTMTQISINAKTVLYNSLFYMNSLYFEILNQSFAGGIDKNNIFVTETQHICTLFSDFGLQNLSKEDFIDYQFNESDYNKLYDILEYSKAYEKAFKKTGLFNDPLFKSNYYVKPSIFGVRSEIKAPIHDIVFEALKVTFRNKIFNSGYKGYCTLAEKDRRQKAEREQRIAEKKIRKATEKAEREAREQEIAKLYEEQKRLELEMQEANKPTFDERVKNVRVIYSLCNQFIEMWDTDRLNLKDSEQAKVVEANLRTMVNRMFSEDKGIGAKLLTRDKYGNVQYAEDGYVALNEENINEQNISKAEDMFENARQWIENIDPDLK